MPSPRFIPALVLAAAWAGGLSGCVAADTPRDAAVAASSLVQVDLVFTREASNIHFGAQGYFARFRAGAPARAATLLGLGHDEQIPLDQCRLVDAAQELDQAFSEGPVELQLLDAGRLLVRGPRDTTSLARRRYPDLTPEVSGVVYSADEGASLELDPAASYDLVGEGGEEIGPFRVSVPSPGAFPGLVVLGARRGGDLELHWTPLDYGGRGDRGRPVLLTVAWTAHSGAAEVHCRVRDSGSFFVPAQLLAAMPSLSSPDNPIEMTATRIERHPFIVPGVGATPGQITLALRDVVRVSAPGAAPP